LIWPEFRMHSILFAWRSILPMMFFWFSSHAAVIVPYRQMFCAFSIFLTMILADVTSSHFKKRGTLQADNTTMRMMPFPEHTPNRLIQVTNFCYSVCQVLAALIVLYAWDLPRLLMVLWNRCYVAFQSKQCHIQNIRTTGYSKGRERCGFYCMGETWKQTEQQQREMMH
jgi:hypothetical protein